MKFMLLKLSALTIITISLLNTSNSSFANNQQIQATSIQKKLAALELASGGQIGISAINTANNHRIQYRAEERFPMQSTFKLIGVAAILHNSMKDHHLLQQKIKFKALGNDSWSPITKKHASEGMTVAELCAATMVYSDDTAINALMKKMGGPKAVTNFARSIGDTVFRLDNWEPQLNSNPADIHDTTTPAAMERSLRRLTLSKVLAAQQREQLITWMKNNTTGNTRIRAGVTKGWIVADKTGTGSTYGITNDIGIIWPPKHAPIVLAIYFKQQQKNTTARNDIIAKATGLLMDEFAKTDQHIKK